jgi:hypothetical protein
MKPTLLLLLGTMACDQPSTTTTTSAAADARDSACHVVNTGALKSCLDAIENEACDDGVDALDRITACRKDALCKM